MGRFMVQLFGSKREPWVEMATLDESMSGGDRVSESESEHGAQNRLLEQQPSPTAPNEATTTTQDLHMPRVRFKTSAVTRELRWHGSLRKIVTTAPDASLTSSSPTTKNEIIVKVTSAIPAPVEEHLEVRGTPAEALRIPLTSLRDWVMLAMLLFVGSCVAAWIAMRT